MLRIRLNNRQVTLKRVLLTPALEGPQQPDVLWLQRTLEDTPPTPQDIGVIVDRLAGYCSLFASMSGFICRAEFRDGDSSLTINVFIEQTESSREYGA